MSAEWAFGEAAGNTLQIGMPLGAVGERVRVVTRQLHVMHKVGVEVDWIVQVNGHGLVLEVGGKNAGRGRPLLYLC